MVEESKHGEYVNFSEKSTDLVSGIINFLPKYPNINVIKYDGDDQDIFTTYPENKFNEEIFTKKEFYDNRYQLDNREDFETFLTGNYQSHQKIIAKYLSSNTTYDKVLLYHALGSGKSSSAIAAIEQIRLEGNMEGDLYIARGKGLIENFQAEILKRTGEKYVPQDDDIDEITERAVRRRTKVKLSEFYNFSTFETFASKIQKNLDYMSKSYSNHIIIIDEIHNIRLQDANKTGSKLKIYDQFYNFLHKVEGSKILLMSGTPMKDNVEELSSVMNLILPESERLPSGKKFLTKYFDKESPYLYSPKSEYVSELKDIFHGKVSFLSSMKNTDVQKEFIGTQNFGKLQHLIVNPNTMSKFQNKIYQKALKEDLKSPESSGPVSEDAAYLLSKESSEKSGVYSKSRQASLFVYPDGSYGSVGFKKYIKFVKSTDDVIGKRSELGVTGLSQQSGRKTHIMSNDLIKELRGNNIKSTISNISKYSCTYAQSVSRVLTAKRDKKNMFVYNELVEGSGMILFSLLLELVGFKITLSVPKGKADRYFIINDNMSPYLVNKIIDFFNSPENMYGEYIRVIIGSRKIGEGYSFSNIQIEDIHTPWFNYSQTYQAIARGLRFKSHDSLIQARQQEGIFDPINVEIYQYVAMPIDTEKTMSIDLNMYEISELKDISIKRVERIMKEAAFDCALNYARNNAHDEDGTRECDYMRCEYKCDGVSTELINSRILESQDYSTFQLFYDSHVIEKLIGHIIEFFSQRFSAYMNEIVAHVLKISYFTRFQILTALRKIISNSIEIVDMYGFLRILKEDMNIYYLTSNLEFSKSFSTSWYTQNPYIKTSKSYDEEVLNIVNSKFNYIIKKLFTSKNSNEIKSLWSQFDIETQEMILEFSIIAQKQKLTKNKIAREIIIEMVSPYISLINAINNKKKKTIISSMLLKKSGILRCLPPSKPYKWIDCTDIEINEFNKDKDETDKTMIESGYGYYGIRNPNTDVFCIRDVTKESEADKRKRTSGKNCETWNSSELLNLAVLILRIPIPDKDSDEYIKIFKKINSAKGTKNIIDDISNPTKDELLKIIRAKSTKAKNLMDMFTVADSSSKMDMIRILYFSSISRKEICGYIRKFFENQNLIQNDIGCGTNAKIKPNI